MRSIMISAYEMAQRFSGMKEIEGRVANPHILAMLQLDNRWPEDDSVPWCSAFVNYVAWLLRLPRSKDLRARSWLTVGLPVPPDQAEPGCDVAIFSRGPFPQPGANVISAPGHVGFYAGVEGMSTLVLGGNQSNTVSVDDYPTENLLGIRRLY